jgi:inner membrane protein
MLDLIESLETWNWFIAGALLLALELLAPGTFMMWFGIAALLVGIISLVVDWTWEAQFVAFAVFAVAAIPLWRRFALVQNPAELPYLNRRLEALVGRVFTLEKPIVDGVGTIRIDDTVWRVRGPEAPAGSRVKVVRADGAQLVVERVDG